MQVFSEKVSPGSVGSATGSVGSVGSAEITIYGAGSVGSVATMGMVAGLRNIDFHRDLILINEAPSCGSRVVGYI